MINLNSLISGDESQYRMMLAIKRMKSTEEGGQSFIKLLEIAQAHLDKKLRNVDGDKFKAVQGAAQVIQDLLGFVDECDTTAEKLHTQIQKARNTA